MTAGRINLPSNPNGPSCACALVAEKDYDHECACEQL